MCLIVEMLKAWQNVCADSATWSKLHLDWAYNKLSKLAFTFIQANTECLISTK